MPDRVRVIRIVEYVGEREWVEKTVANAVHGTRQFGPQPYNTVTAATLGDFPETISDAFGSGKCLLCGAGIALTRHHCDECLDLWIEAKKTKADAAKAAKSFATQVGLIPPVACARCGMNVEVYYQVQPRFKGGNLGEWEKLCGGCLEQTAKEMMEPFSVIAGLTVSNDQ